MEAWERKRRGHSSYAAVVKELGCERRGDGWMSAEKRRWWRGGEVSGPAGKMVVRGERRLLGLRRQVEWWMEESIGLVVGEEEKSWTVAHGEEGRRMIGVRLRICVRVLIK